MSNERTVSSYDSGCKPFKHDVGRAKWASEKDFYAGCLCHSFSLKHFSFIPAFAVSRGGILILIPYIFGMLLFAVPTFFVQSFLGQFTTSGFISAFRIAPLFKGIGYLILALNLTTVSYYIVYAAISLIYLFDSLSATLPWEGCKHSWNTKNCTNDFPKYLNDSNTYYHLSWSVTEYLNFVVMGEPEPQVTEELTLSWRIIICNAVILIALGLIICRGTEFIGKALRYSTIFIASFLLLLFIRLLFVPGSMKHIADFFTPHPIKIIDIGNWLLGSFLTTLMFGGGWGTVLTMASYNEFKTDIGKAAWIIGLINLGILIVCGIMVQIVDEWLTEEFKFYTYTEDEYSLFVGYATFSFFFTKIGLSQMWSLIFFSIIFVGEFTGCLIQIFSITTAIFDEYDVLRIYKRETTYIMLFFFFLTSLVLTTNYGMEIIIHMSNVSGDLTMFICFIEIFVVVWIYGKDRFQQDVHFMLSQTYANWKFYILRYITPCIALFILALRLLHDIFQSYYISYQIIYLFFKYAPILFLPAYLIWKLHSTTGRFQERFNRLCHPTDWYPCDPDEKSKYDDSIGSDADTFKQFVNVEDLNCNQD